MNPAKKPYEPAKLEVIVLKTEDILFLSFIFTDGGLEWDKNEW